MYCIYDLYNVCYCIHFIYFPIHYVTSHSHSCDLHLVEHNCDRKLSRVKCLEVMFGNCFFQQPWAHLLSQLLVPILQHGNS